MKKLLSLLLCAAMTFSLASCGKQELPQPQPAPVGPDLDGAVTIELSDEKISVTEGGISAWTEIPLEGDDYAGMHNDKVFVTNDIVYYEDGRDFTYGEGTEADAHTAEEAAAHTVVTIRQPGTYVLCGKLSAGQIAVDLGEEAKTDVNAVVTLVLYGVDITCTVAPAIIFYNVYECGDKDNPTKDVETHLAGANVYIIGNTENTVNGSYVARIYDPGTVELNEDGTEVEDAKKLHKYDAAFYSRMSMNVDGAQSGILNINAENEGLDSEMHLTINGGTIYIKSGNDGINTNEDGVSVTTINGGRVEITVTGETGEGDGIDSNGWLVINEGATVIASACGDSMDAGIDSDMGIHIDSGTLVIASGHMLDRIEGADQNYAVFQFGDTRPGGELLTLKDANGAEAVSIEPANDYSVVLVSMYNLLPGEYTLWSGETQLGHSGIQTGGMGGFAGGGGRPDGMVPGGMKPPEDFDPETMAPPTWNEGVKPEKGERPEPPEGFEPGKRPVMPGGMEIHSDVGFGPGPGLGGGKQGATEAVFTISAVENYFSGVGELSK